MPRESDYEALRRAAAPTLERIRREGEALPGRLAKVVAYVMEHLFDPSLNATQARLACGIRDRALSSEFRDFVGKTLRTYIEEARLEVADRLLRGTEMGIGRVGQAVGYANHGTFLNAYRALTGERPSDVRGKPDEPMVDYPTWRRLVRGDLESSKARELMRKLAVLYPEAGAVETLPGRPERQPAEQPVVVDGKRYERFIAEDLWREMCDLPPEEQRRRVRRHRFHSSALFDVLRERSRVEGRRDRQRGVDLARLALESLDGGEEIFGEEIHDLRALGWAWLGNAHRLALDFIAADEAFESADEAWRVLRMRPDIRVSAEMGSLKGSLLICQRRYLEALELLDDSHNAFILASDSHGEARVLIQKATSLFYLGERRRAESVLLESESLLAASCDPYLLFVACDNLANVYARSGNYVLALGKVDQCREICRRMDSPLPAYLKTQWVEAMIRHGLGDTAAAERLYLASRVGFIEISDLGNLGILCLDFASLLAEQDRWDDSLSLLLEALPILKSLSLHNESSEAITLLSKGLETQTVPSVLITKVRDAILKDPLIGLIPRRRVG